jgi:hypothetical protein
VARENSLAPSQLQTNLRYANALRCIGQSIEPMELKAVELKLQGETYAVQGWTKGNTASNFDKLYTPEDIKCLDVEGRKKRAAQSELPNLLSLSQVLRLAGNYVDRLHGRLLRVSWQDQSDKIQSVTIQYDACGAHERSEDSQIATVEELCIHIYKQRKRIASGSDKSPRTLANIGVGN